MTQKHDELKHLHHFYKNQLLNDTVPFWFPKSFDEAFGGWTKADKEHFADGGSFDQIYARK